MPIRKLLLLLFLVALTSISLGSVALGGSDQSRVAKPLADHYGFTLECYSYNELFQATVQFWWTRGGKFHRGEDDWEKGVLECWGNAEGYSSSSTEFDTPETPFNDFHKVMIVTDWSTGQQTICTGDYKFQTGTPEEFTDTQPAWFYQQCYINSLFDGDLQWAVFYSFIIE